MKLLVTCTNKKIRCYLLICHFVIFYIFDESYFQWKTTKVFVTSTFYGIVDIFAGNSYINTVQYVKVSRRPAKMLSELTQHAR